MSGHYHYADCTNDALERIADLLERIADVVDEWADANRTPRLVVDFNKDSRGYYEPPAPPLERD